MKTEIIIVRHGESLGNINRIMLGNTDLDMSLRGYKQAEACADFLAEETIDAIYSSDLIRAYNTAKPHAERHGLEIIKDERLREMHVGAWENRPFVEIAEEYPEMHREWRETYATIVFPGGESVAEAGKRFWAAVVDIAEKIGTFETSILPYEDCCTTFVAKHPVTKPSLKSIEKSELKLTEDIDRLVEEALKTVETIVIK